MVVTTWNEVFTEEPLSPEEELIQALREANRHRRDRMEREIQEHQYIYGQSPTEDSFRSTYSENHFFTVGSNHEQSGSDDDDDEQEDSSRVDAIVEYLRGLSTR